MTYEPERASVAGPRPPQTLAGRCCTGGDTLYFDIHNTLIDAESELDEVIMKAKISFLRRPSAS